MKKCILSALAGALAMLLLIYGAVNLLMAKNTEQKDYQHIDYTSSIEAEYCFVCSEQGLHWGEDNVGILNLNTFELLYIPINRYGDQGELIEGPSGVMLSCSLSDPESESYVNANVFPDNAYAHLTLSGVKYNVNRETVQNRLCQNCLNTINKMWFTTQAPAEYAVISFEDKTIQLLLNSVPWFASGNYGIDCEFKADGAIDLLIHYCPVRYE